MQPKRVIPCHYNCPAFFSRKINPADDKLFKAAVEKMNIKCVILQKNDSIGVQLLTYEFNAYNKANTQLRRKAPLLRR